MIQDELETMYASVRKLTSRTHSIMLSRSEVDKRAAASSRPKHKPKHPSAKRGG